MASFGAPAYSDEEGGGSAFPTGSRDFSDGVFGDVGENKDGSSDFETGYTPVNALPREPSVPKAREATEVLTDVLGQIAKTRARAGFIVDLQAISELSEFSLDFNSLFSPLARIIAQVRSESEATLFQQSDVASLANILAREICDPDKLSSGVRHVKLMLLHHLGIDLNAIEAEVASSSPISPLNSTGVEGKDRHSSALSEMEIYFPMTPTDRFRRVDIPFQPMLLPEDEDGLDLVDEVEPGDRSPEPVENPPGSDDETPDQIEDDALPSPEISDSSPIEPAHLPALTLMEELRLADTIFAIDAALQRLGTSFDVPSTARAEKTSFDAVPPRVDPLARLQRVDQLAQAGLIPMDPPVSVSQLALELFLRPVPEEETSPDDFDQLL